MTIKELIKLKSEECFNEVVKLRRHLHMHPELSFHENETAAFVANHLKSLGIPFKDKVADTGLVAIIEGKNPDKAVVALRADMDALPIQEQNDVPYKSKNAGLMHACGHDVHTSSL